MAFVQVSSNFDNTLSRAVKYLESNLRLAASDPYALSIITYALTLANSSEANSALRQLNNLAINEGLPAAFILSLKRLRQEIIVIISCFIQKDQTPYVLGKIGGIGGRCQGVGLYSQRGPDAEPLVRRSGANLQKLKASYCMRS